MSKRVAMEIRPTANPSLKGGSETRAVDGTLTMIVKIMVVLVLVAAALTFSLFHVLGWKERVAVTLCVVALAGGITYTLRRFLRGPVKSRSARIYSPPGRVDRR